MPAAVSRALPKSDSALLRPDALFDEREAGRGARRAIYPPRKTNARRYDESLFLSPVIHVSRLYPRPGSLGRRACNETNGERYRVLSDLRAYALSLQLDARALCFSAVDS